MQACKEASNVRIEKKGVLEEFSRMAHKDESPPQLPNHSPGLASFLTLFLALCWPLCIEGLASLACSAFGAYVH